MFKDVTYQVKKATDDSQLTTVVESFINKDFAKNLATELNQKEEAEFGPFPNTYYYVNTIRRKLA